MSLMKFSSRNLWNFYLQEMYNTKVIICERIGGLICSCGIVSSNYFFNLPSFITLWASESTSTYAKVYSSLQQLHMQKTHICMKSCMHEYVGVRACVCWWYVCMYVCVHRQSNTCAWVEQILVLCTLRNKTVHRIIWMDGLMNEYLTACLVICLFVRLSVQQPTSSLCELFSCAASVIASFNNDNKQHSSGRVHFRSAD